ncbi:MAG: hypothetical protein J5I98_04205 [Phaeodactylibacter sp.]|nr:hypothetical protein [Phaeodactylibacter sp.]
MSHRIILPFAFFFLAYAPSRAQIRTGDEFARLLGQAGIEFIEPVEANYKQTPVWKNPIQSYDYAIRSRKEGIEIRYLIRPYELGAPTADAPHVEASRLAMHLATNDQDYRIAAREIDPEILSDGFHADWGMQFFFRPKASFARWNHCELLALHKDGRGTAFVIFLFDEPSRELGLRFYALQFREEGLGKVDW